MAPAGATGASRARALDQLYGLSRVLGTGLPRRSLLSFPTRQSPKNHCQQPGSLKNFLPPSRIITCSKKTALARSLELCVELIELGENPEALAESPTRREQRRCPCCRGLPLLGRGTNNKCKSFRIETA